MVSLYGFSGLRSHILRRPSWHFNMLCSFSRALDPRALLDGRQMRARFVIKSLRVRVYWNVYYFPYGEYSPRTAHSATTYARSARIRILCLTIESPLVVPEKETVVRSDSTRATLCTARRIRGIDRKQQ